MKCIPISLIFLVCFVLGGALFKYTTPPKCTNLQQDDSIFVLTGDTRRIPYALNKLDNLQYGQLYVIGAGVENAVLLPHVKVESSSKSTYQNALAIKNIVEQTNLNRIVLVTTEDHMHRALHLIRHEIPQTDIVACPASLIGMQTPERVKRWTIEYVKYIATIFGIKES